MFVAHSIYFFFSCLYFTDRKTLYLSTNPVQLMHKYEVLHKSFYYEVYLQEQNMAKVYIIKGYYKNLKL